MCFYIYAPGNNMQIDYASETVTLTKGDTSILTFDFLATNKSRDPIESIHILYPRLFFPKPRDPESFSKPAGKFEDITDNLTDFRSPYNRLNLSSPCKLTSKRLEDAKIKLDIEQPNPSNPSEIISYSGLIEGKHHIQFREGLTVPQLKILTELGFSIFVCKLNVPMITNQPRWFRWYVAPYQTALTKRGKISWFKDWLINRLVSHYQILGPENVKYQLITALESYIDQCLSDDLSRQDPQLTEAQELLITLKGEIESSNINWQDLRLHVFPGVFGDLNRVNYDGDIKVCGTLPNLLDYNNRFPSEFCYQWKAGEKYIPVRNQQNKGRFSTTFSGTMPNRFVRSLPWIALVIGIIDFLLTLIVLYSR